MYIFNTTFAAEPAVEKELIEWLHGELIPSATVEGDYFTAPELMRVLSQDENNPLALHMRAQTLDDIRLWYEDHGSRLFDYVQQRWGGRVVFFSTTLEVL